MLDCGIFLVREELALQIIYKDKNIVAVNKAAGIPSQPDPSGDPDAMSLTSLELSKLGERDELFLVHRLDRVVGGVLVFARNKKYAAILSELIASHKAEKVYIAVVEGNAEGGEMRDLLFKDARAGKSFVVDRRRAGVKEAVLEYSRLSSVESERGERSLVEIKLKTGRFHQIRCQFSSRGMPIVGDGKYGSHDNAAKMPALFAKRLTLPFENKTVTVSASPDMDSYPWSLFDIKNSEEKI